MSMTKRKLAIIGGSGFYSFEGVKNITAEKVETPFGKPSNPVQVLEIVGQEVLFINRHGLGHAFPPHAINYRANIYALKSLGATHLISVTAVGSLKQSLEPGMLVLPDQFIDLTRQRKSTFFDHCAVHAPFGRPVCHCLQSALNSLLGDLFDVEDYSPTIKDKTILVTMEGPSFSTRAESFMYKFMQADLIGMTTITEAKLAREAELCFIPVAMVTDYDSWHGSEEEDVDVVKVVSTLKKNVHKAQKLVCSFAEILPKLQGQCHCQSALDSSIMSNLKDLAKQPGAELLLGKYLPK